MHFHASLGAALVTSCFSFQAPPRSTKQLGMAGRAGLQGTTRLIGARHIKLLGVFNLVDNHLQQLTMNVHTKKEKNCCWFYSFFVIVLCTGFLFCYCLEVKLAHEPVFPSACRLVGQSVCLSVGLSVCRSVGRFLYNSFKFHSPCSYRSTAFIAALYRFICNICTPCISLFSCTATIVLFLNC